MLSFPPIPPWICCLLQRTSLQWCLFTVIYLLGGAFFHMLFNMVMSKYLRKPFLYSWGHNPSDPSVLKAHNDEVIAATNFLIEKVIPDFAVRFQEFFEATYNFDDQNSLRWDESRNNTPRIRSWLHSNHILFESRLESAVWKSVAEGSRILVIDMHREGINMRYLGYLRNHITNKHLKLLMLMGQSNYMSHPRLVHTILKSAVFFRCKNIQR